LDELAEDGFLLTGDVSSPSYYSGGICGVHRTGTIQNCFVSNCQIKNGNDATRSRIGRIGGFDTQNASLNNGIYKNCYADISVSINGNAISNQDENSRNGKDALTTNFQSQSWIESTLDWDFENVWIMSESGQFPVLRVHNPELVTSVEQVKNNEEKKPIAYYSVMGAKLPKVPEKGMYIVLYSNGTTQKLMK